MPEPDCFLRYHVGYITLQPCLDCPQAALLRGFYVVKIPRIRIGSAPLEWAVVLQWFYSLSRRKTFVGGKCALPSALLVIASASDLPLRTVECCLVVFGVTLTVFLPWTLRRRLPLKTNAAAYQRLVSTTCHSSSQLSVLHLAVEPFTARDRATYWPRIAYPTSIRRSR